MHRIKQKISYLFILIFVCFILILGCSKKEIVNDTATGEIFNSNHLETFVDGTYTATSKYYNPQSYGLKMIIEVHRGIITHVQYQEINSQGINRLSDPLAVTTWPESDLNLNQIYSKLYTNFIIKQKPEVDTITGATQTVDHFKILSNVVYTNAKAGTPSSEKVNTFVQTYTAENPIDDPTGYRSKLTITFDGDTMTSVNYDELKESTSKSANLLYKQLFNVFSKETLQRQNLTPLDSDPIYAFETLRYNNLLQSIATQRVLFEPN